ncbi:metacaspase-1 isoform X2 [Brachypodium distachyon]|uniref:metacaspase-1 isoform X2 n=1 Tax=Brachypodium distachyon TaxID=15368 RepID=UPI000D0CDB42|nr:metacaspase-1 isoform X2 [Brachypodium distachyon]|eukprot:XP_024312583.1 metacaspase-1 isoform X2 [Brachypodium distachyon]
MVQTLRRVPVGCGERALRPVRSLPRRDPRGAPAAAPGRPAPGHGLHQGSLQQRLRFRLRDVAAAALVLRVHARRRRVRAAGQLPARPEQQEARAPRRHQLRLHQVRAQGQRQRRQLHALPAPRQVQLPHRLHPHPYTYVVSDEKDPYRVPTKDNLRLAMRWLVEGCTSGDSLVFHFSGHGVQKLDNNGDEMDGYDEALCPQDFEDRGVILDDEINETIVRPLGPGVKLHAIIDTCHSGTILDLPYLCRISRTGYWQWESQARQQETPKGTNGGIAISFSGCGDSQNSADTTSFSGSASTGAMTYSFIKAVLSEPGPTYGRLLSAMRATIRDNGGECGIPGPIGSFFRRVITFSCAQEPQLCASETFDIYRKPFLL